MIEKSRTARSWRAACSCVIGLPDRARAALGLRASPGPEVGAPLQLDGVVDPFVADYIEAASIEPRRGAPAVLITIDTPGGLDSSMRQIIQAMLNATMPVICYVAPQGARAASAGAFILISCPVAAMAPATNVAPPPRSGLGGVDAREKVANDAAAYIRSIAEQLRTQRRSGRATFVREATSITAEEALDAGVIDLDRDPERRRCWPSVDGGTSRSATARR